MATSPRSAIALPWYARGNYPALLKLFSDPDKLPATYDAWLKRAELTEKQLQKAGSMLPGSRFVLVPSPPGARSGTFPPIKRRA